MLVFVGVCYKKAWAVFFRGKNTNHDLREFVWFTQADGIFRWCTTEMVGNASTGRLIQAEEL